MSQAHTDMQDVRAPFVLENLACTGTEARLLDCPVSRVNRDPAATEDYTYYETDYNDRLCDPSSESSAFVACGMLAEPGTVSYAHCEVPCTGAAVRSPCECSRPTKRIVQRWATSGWLAV